MDPAERTLTPPRTGRGGFGAIIRRARQTASLTQADLGAITGYSAAQISRYERGLSPLTDMGVLRRFADALGIPPPVFGLTVQPITGEPGHAAAISLTRRPGSGGPTVAGGMGWEDGEDPVRRRQLLVNLAVTATAATGTSIAGNSAVAGQAAPGELLVTRVRDAMLGLGRQPSDCSLGRLRAGLATALSDFHGCRYVRLAGQLPRLISGGHAAASAGEDPDVSAVLAEVYTLVTRMLIKLDC